MTPAHASQAVRPPGASAMKGTYAYDTDVVMPMDDDNGGTVVIHTTVTNSGDAVKLFLQEVRRKPGVGGGGEPLIVGLDTEWRAIFHEGRRQGGHRMAVLQLCVGRRCLVFQTAHADYVPAALLAFLASTKHRFVGVGVDGDVERLYCDCRILVNSALDLRHVAAEVLSRPELRRAGLKALAREVMGVILDKPRKVTMSAWGSRDLSPEQVRYAAIDAFVSYEVGRLLLASQRAKDAATNAGATTMSPFVSYFELP